jgi:hypothetical protein
MWVMEMMTMTHAELIASYKSGSTIKMLTFQSGISRGSLYRLFKSIGFPMRRTGPPLYPKTINIPVDKTIIAYIAGLFDGEGNLQWRHRTGRAASAKLSIYNTDAGIIDWLHEKIGGTVLWDHARVIRRGWKPMGSWQIHRANDVIAMLSCLIPYLIIKRESAATMLSDLKEVAEVWAKINRRKKRFA